MLDYLGEFPLYNDELKEKKSWRRFVVMVDRIKEFISIAYEYM